MKKVKVYLDDRKNGGRKLVEVELLEENTTSIRVRLSDGNVIKRKKVRDLPKGEIV